jgi:hypothetical protein
MYIYSDPTRESDPHALPNIEVFWLTARDLLDMGWYEDEVHEARKLHRFRVAGMHGRVSEAVVDYVIETCGIEGGWFWQACFPGCLPDGDPMGPFASEADAIADAQAC